MTTDASLLTVDDVHKQFARIHAVAGVSLNISRGDIFALLGPNGAGKSTLLRMLVGITRPDRGRIAWMGRSDDAARVALRMGYLPEDRGLYQDVPVSRVLAYFGTLRGMTHAAAVSAAADWLERLSLRERAGDLVRTLSKGNQQKVQFAAAVLHRPEFVILDEPFSGLDPINQEVFLDLVRGLRANGTTVLLSAHQMSLVERLADHVFIMQGGREVLSGTVPQIRERWGAGLTLILQAPTFSDVGERAVAVHPAVTSAVQRDGELRVEVKPTHPVGDLLAVCLAHFAITGVRTEQSSLHEVYVATVGAAAPTALAAVTATEDAA